MPAGVVFCANCGENLITGKVLHGPHVRRKMVRILAKAGTTGLKLGVAAAVVLGIVYLAHSTNVVHRLKGYVKHEGKWVAPERKQELEHARFEREQIEKGFIKFGDKWITKKQYEQEIFEQQQRAKGLVKYEGKWITPEEKRKLEEQRFAEQQRAKGLVLFEGRWMRPQEKKAIEAARLARKMGTKAAGPAEEGKPAAKQPTEAELKAAEMVKIYKGKWLTPEEAALRNKMVLVKGDYTDDRRVMLAFKSIFQKIGMVAVFKADRADCAYLAEVDVGKTRRKRTNLDKVHLPSGRTVMARGETITRVVYVTVYSLKILNPDAPLSELKIARRKLFELRGSATASPPKTGWADYMDELGVVRPDEWRPLVAAIHSIEEDLKARMALARSGSSF